MNKESLLRQKTFTREDLHNLKKTLELENNPYQTQDIERINDILESAENQFIWGDDPYSALKEICIERMSSDMRVYGPFIAWESYLDNEVIGVLFWLFGKPVYSYSI